MIQKRSAISSVASAPVMPSSTPMKHLTIRRSCKIQTLFHLETLSCRSSSVEIDFDVDNMNREFSVDFLKGADDWNKCADSGNGYPCRVRFNNIFYTKNIFISEIDHQD